MKFNRRKKDAWVSLDLSAPFQIDYCHQGDASWII